MPGDVKRVTDNEEPWIFTRERPGNSSEHGRVYQWLKTMLIEYRFHPGEQILIAPLADHLRVSATPIRETLIRPHAEEFLDTGRKRGFFAKRLSQKEMMELSQLRFTILRHVIEDGLESPHIAARVAQASTHFPWNVSHDSTSG
jgi:DNA-binding GntR family transcriptional regulator